MHLSKFHLNRRLFLKSALLSSAASFAATALGARERGRREILFNGRNLHSWTQLQNSQFSFSRQDIINPRELDERIKAKGEPVSRTLAEQLKQVAVNSGAAPPSNAEPDAPVLAHALNQLITGPSLYEAAIVTGVHLRPETRKLLHSHPQGSNLIWLNRLLLEDAYTSEIVRANPVGWIAKDGAIASTGAGRGVLYSDRDFSRCRLQFTMRHVSGKPDHQACVLIFCTRPEPDAIPLDALGGIQFQVPNGGHWDYRPGHNNAGGEEFTSVAKTAFDPHQWSRVEIVADASTGTARMAVAQPVGSRAVEVLRFADRSAGKAGPIALQMHNAGLYDEYRDITADQCPDSLDLITT